MISAFSKNLGISAIAVYEPDTTLSNAWFGPVISRKFEHHTGIKSRAVSWTDEVAMGVEAVKRLQADTGCDLADCAAIVFASPSFVPLSIARQHFEPARAKQEQLMRAAHELTAQLQIPRCPVYGLNWFCSGYAKAMEEVRRHLVPILGLAANQYILVVTSTRISRITDYGCSQTGALFGDMATATLIARTDSAKFPVHFKLLYARAEKQPAASVMFNFVVRKNVLQPLESGEQTHSDERLVFTLDGMGIADIAPRAMTSAVAKALKAKRMLPEHVSFVVPHQAGTGIIRLATMKLEEIGIQAEVVNGLTSKVGNVSSSSIPYALKQKWNHLSGIIACPTAAVGTPGKAEVSQGCILLESTSAHKS